MTTDKTRKVYIIQSDSMMDAMFKNFGWEITRNFNEADLVQFTGGEDVSPILYGEQRHRRTSSNPARDKREKVFFEIAKKKDVPMAGICRGGQFLNVMCGGWLWQDCNHHMLAGSHPVLDEITGEIYQATSTHHQMMRPGKYGRVIATAGEATFVEYCTKTGHESCIGRNPLNNKDVEVIHYPIENCLCVQYHPEHDGWHDLQAIYFKMIEEYLFKTITVKQ